MCNQPLPREVLTQGLRGLPRGSPCAGSSETAQGSPCTGPAETARGACVWGRGGQAWGSRVWQPPEGTLHKGHQGLCLLPRGPGPILRPLRETQL